MLAAAREENSDASPLDNTLQKGVAFNVYHTQFRRAIGVMATRTAAQVKLRRTAYIRSTKAEAASAARPDEYNFYPDHGNHWYSNRQNHEHFQEFYAYHMRNDNQYGKKQSRRTRQGRISESKQEIQDTQERDRENRYIQRKSIRYLGPNGRGIRKNDGIHRKEIRTREVECDTIKIAHEE